MISTENVSPSTVLTVSETPSSATEPLGAMKRASVARRAKRKARHIGHVLARNDGGKAVDMTGDHMAAQLVAQFQRALEIDLAARPPAAGGGQPQRLGGGINREPGAPVFFASLDDGEADAGAGHRRALHQRGARIGTGDGDAGQIVGARLDRPHFAHIGDDAGEH